MFPGLFPELDVSILSYLSPRRQGLLSCTSTEFYRYINSQDNYRAITTSYGLPRIVGHDVLKRASHYIRILSRKDRAKYWYIITCAIHSGDLEWVIDHGIDLVKDVSAYEIEGMQQLLLRFFVISNSIEGVKKLLSAFTDNIVRLKSSLRIFAKQNDLTIFDYVYSTYGFRPIRAGDIVQVACLGNEQLTSRILDKVTQHNNIRSRIPAGYLIGSHHELYSKYRQIYQTTEQFRENDVMLALEYGNADILKRLRDLGLVGKPSRFWKLKAFARLKRCDADFADLALQMIGLERPNDFSDVLMSIRHADVALLKKILSDHSICSTVQASGCSLTARTHMMDNFDNYRTCIRVAIAHFDKEHQTLRNHLCESSVKYGNLELMQILSEI